jgi:hypothetical protein
MKNFMHFLDNKYPESGKRKETASSPEKEYAQETKLAKVNIT